MDIEERLSENKRRIQRTQINLQRLEEEKQQLLQALLRLDGENNILLELKKEKAPEPEKPEVKKEQ